MLISNSYRTAHNKRLSPATQPPSSAKDCAIIVSNILPVNGLEGKVRSDNELFNKRVHGNLMILLVNLLAVRAMYFL
jgi:hypothetical protein